MEVISEFFSGHHRGMEALDFFVRDRLLERVHFGRLDQVTRGALLFAKTRGLEVIKRHRPTFHFCIFCQQIAVCSWIVLHGRSEMGHLNEKCGRRLQLVIDIEKFRAMVGTVFFTVAKMHKTNSVDAEWLIKKKQEMVEEIGRLCRLVSDLQ